MTSPDFYDKLLSHYLKNWLVSGEGERRTPHIRSLDLGFWELRAGLLADHGWIEPSTLHDDLMRMGKPDLQSLSRKRGLPTSGTKKSLTERLLARKEKRLRQAVPGPYWKASADFQKMLDKEMDRRWWLYEIKAFDIPRFNIISFDRACDGKSENKWYEMLWAEGEKLKSEIVAEAEMSFMVNACALHDNEDSVRLKQRAIANIERRQFELLLYEGKDGAAGKHFPELYKEYVDSSGIF